jgi:Tfp pilus assembly protein PilN
MAKNKFINLLPQEEFESSAVGRVLRWAMGTFRMIVIATELVVMCAFLSRFWLDAQNATLSDSIKVASSQIQVQSNFEKTFRNVQRKLTIFDQIKLTSKNSGKVDLIASKIPEDVMTSSITIQETSALIKGLAGSEYGVAQFVSNLKSDKTIKDVTLTNLDSSENNQSQLVFLINIKY